MDIYFKITIKKTKNVYFIFANVNKVKILVLLSIHFLFSNYVKHV